MSNTCENIKHKAHNLEESDQRTRDVITDEDLTFSALFLKDLTMRGLTQCGFVKPSPVQLKAIPLGKCGFDLIVEAKSGTGKTAVFSVIALESIQLDIGCQCVVIAPTREIAVQIAQVVTSIGCAYKGLKVEVVMGGTDFAEDITRLNSSTKYQILVGTPGRLKHLIKSQIISMDTVRVFVLDEADKLMEHSFKRDINFIFSSLPERRQVIVASATYTAELRNFLSNYMTSPSHINPYSSRILLGIKQYLTIVQTHLFDCRQSDIILEELERILSNVQFKQCLVFCNYQGTTRDTWRHLIDKGWPAEYLSGCQKQEERLKSLEKLQSFQCRILVATDLAARGLDAANVDLVIGLDIPYDLATYLHRIGRCGRYGAKGNAVTILPGRLEQKFRDLLEKYGDSFDIKPLDCLLDSKTVQNDKSPTIEMKPNVKNTTIEFTSLFANPKKCTDDIIDLFKQEHVDMLLDPTNEFSIEDYHSCLLKIGNEDVVPEFDYINYLKNNVPDYDEMIACIKNDYLDNYYIIDANSNIDSTNDQEVSSVMAPFENIIMDQSKKESKTGKKKRKNNVKTPKVVSDVVEEETLIVTQEETVESDGDLEMEGDANEDYWRWRNQLSMMSAYIQQCVYLQTLTQLENMNLENS